VARAGMPSRRSDRGAPRARRSARGSGLESPRDPREGDARGAHDAVRPQGPVLGTGRVMTRASVARRGSWIGAIGALVVLTVGAGLESGCSGGREARLQEVLRRSRAAPETISSIEKPFLLDPEPDVRALAVWAIGDARAPHAVEVLSPLAKDPAPVVRLAVVRALCPISPTSAPEAVLALVQDSDGETRRAAVRCVA